MNIIITMAGEGARFQKIGIKSPKHMIHVKGRTLFWWSMHSLKHFFDHNFVFVTRSSHHTRRFIELECDKLGISKIEILELDAATAGQAETALRAKEVISKASSELLIYNIDTYVEPDCLTPVQIRGDGWIPVFKAEGDRWSFCTFDENGRVARVAEKKRISEFATIGLYYFRSLELYEECVRNIDDRNSPERYVAPLYEHLLRNPRYEVFTEVLPSEAVHVLGTPEDIKIFCPEFAP